MLGPEKTAATGESLQAYAPTAAGSIHSKELQQMQADTAINPRRVQIGDVDLDQIFYRGNPVVTLAQIDKAHKRPDDTAGRNFRTNRTRFAELVDFVTVDQPDEIRRLGITRPQGGTAASVTLITRRGYLKLVKSLNDDLAWSVFDDMIERYFAIGRRSVITAASALKDAVGVFSAYRRLGRLIGLDKNQALIAANQATLKRTGENMLADVGVTHLLAPEQVPILTPSQIGERMGGLSGKRINLALAAIGVQMASPHAQGGPNWEPTKTGEPYAKWQDTGKRHGDGTPVRQLKWLSTVIDLLRPGEAA